MSVRAQIDLRIKFDGLVLEACRLGYEQAIAQAESEEESIAILSTEIHDKVIKPFFESEEFKMIHNQPKPGVDPCELVQIQYKSSAEAQIEKTVKAAWQLEMKRKAAKEQKTKSSKMPGEKLSSDQNIPKRAYKSLFRKKT
jgi:hypothetical protein